MEHELAVAQNCHLGRMWSTSGDVFAICAAWLDTFIAFKLYLSTEERNNLYSLNEIQSLIEIIFGWLGSCHSCWSPFCRRHVFDLGAMPRRKTNRTVHADV